MSVNWLALMSRLYEADGYIVLGSNELWEEGEICPERFNTGVRLRILGRATRQDALRQLALIEQWGKCHLEQPPFPDYFYKTAVVVDA